MTSQQTLSLSFKNTRKEILLNQIVWMRKDKNKLEICHYDGKEYIIDIYYSTLDKITEQLNECFLRINRGDIIHLAQIERFNDEEITTLDGTTFPISKSKIKQVALAYAMYKSKYKL